MKKGLFFITLACVCSFMFGCTSIGKFPHTTGTQVDLTKKNYKVVKANAIGSSSGFRLLGLIPFSSPRYTKAMSSLHKNSGMEVGKAQALVNVSQERSTTYLILFSVPKLKVKAGNIAIRKIIHPAYVVTPAYVQRICKLIVHHILAYCITKGGGSKKTNRNEKSFSSRKSFSIQLLLSAVYIGDVGIFLKFRLESFYANINSSGPRIAVHRCFQS